MNTVIDHTDGRRCLTLADHAEIVERGMAALRVLRVNENGGDGFSHLPHLVYCRDLFVVRITP
jgi:hypothetical protein